MDKLIKHPSVIDGKNPNELRGDSITNDRYFCKDFMDKRMEPYVDKGMVDSW